MTKEELQERSKIFAIHIYKLCKKLDKGYDQNVVGYQLARSSTSVAANYRAACRARSPREFAAKLSICIEECDEVMFWLDFLCEVSDYGDLDPLKKESNELLSIFIASRKTVVFKIKSQNQ